MAAPIMRRLRRVAIEAMHKFPIYRAVTYQTLVWLAISLMALLARGKLSGYSVALGGLISLLPGIYFMVRYFKYSGARAMEQVVRNAFYAEIMKLVLIGLGFVLIFRLVKPLSPADIFGGFLVVQVANMAITAKLINRKFV